MTSACVKCNEDGAIILVGTNGSFCKDCFEKYFTHKFRASLGKNPVVRHGDKVAVAFSGGNNSSALLHVLLKSLSPTAFKRLKFHAGIIFIDETTILPPTNYQDYLSKIEYILEQSGLPHNTVKLEEVLFLQDSSLFDNHSETERSNQLMSLFESMKTLTSKEELLYRLRCKLLAFKAKHFGYQHVFLGETSTRLAINILSNIAQGRGAHLSLDTGFTDHGRYFGVNLLRPLRDISAKEVAVYNRIHQVSTVFLPTLSTKLPANSSIQRLTEDFIVSLSADFPSTETTVYRTSNKLKMTKTSERDTEKEKRQICSLCCGPLDTFMSEDNASALQAMEFTKKLGAGEFGSPEENLCNTRTSSGILNGIDQFADIGSNLCHSCKILQKDTSNDRTNNILECFLTSSSDTRDKISHTETSMGLEDLNLNT